MSTETEGFRTLKLAEQTYRIRYSGTHQPLEFERDAVVWQLPVWCYQDHMQAMQAALVAADTGLRLNTERLVAPLLQSSDLPQADWPMFNLLALWWIAGAEGLDARPQGQGWLLRDRCVYFKPWSEQQRALALQACFTQDEAQVAQGLGEFDSLHYLDRMIRASLMAVEPAFPLEHFDSAQTAFVIDHVVNINSLNTEADTLFSTLDEQADSALAQQNAQRTLRLCQALGWTPSQVWATPAVEVDRLLSLLAMTQPEPQKKSSQVTSVAPRSPRLADAPDAIVIQVED